MNFDQAEAVCEILIRVLLTRGPSIPTFVQIWRLRQCSDLPQGLYDALGNPYQDILNQFHLRILIRITTYLLVKQVISSREILLLYYLMIYLNDNFESPEIPEVDAFEMLNNLFDKRWEDYYNHYRQMSSSSDARDVLNFIEETSYYGADFPLHLDSSNTIIE